MTGYVNALWCLLGVIVVSTVANTIPPPPPNPWQVPLKLHRAPVTFNEAFKICNAEGGVLASPLDDGMKKAMVEKMSQDNISCGVFTGIHSTFYKGVFTSVEGVPLDAIPAEWAPGEPDNFENKEECIIMTVNGSLADVNCNETLPFMCYKSTNDEAANVCGTTDAEYIFDKRTGSCYKFHAIGVAWPYAFMQCVSEKGHLVVINSETESQVVKELFQKYPVEKITATEKNAIHAGFYRKQEPNVWYTVHGQTLRQAGFWTFGKTGSNVAQPDDPEKSFCGAVFRTGLLDDVRCLEFNLPFICERPGLLL